MGKEDLVMRHSIPHAAPYFGDIETLSMFIQSEHGLKLYKAQISKLFWSQLGFSPIPLKLDIYYIRKNRIECPLGGKREHNTLLYCIGTHKTEPEKCDK